MPLEVSDSSAIGAYRLLEPLGRGAFGEVWKALDTERNREVALKELVRVRPAALTQFKQEFRAMRTLRHPNLVRMLEMFEHEGRWFIAMQLVTGEELSSWVRPLPASGEPANDNQPAFDEARLRKAFLGMARGLAALHAAGLVHRDLKPTNVRVSSGGHAVLLDFGLVAGVGGDTSSQRPQGPGTAAFMAPEQAEGKPVDATADWYAFGTCLYLALTGDLPFAGTSPLAIMMAKLRERPRPLPTTGVGAVPEDLAHLCLALLDPEPASRATETDVLRVLEGEDGRVRSDPPWAPVKPLPPLAFPAAETSEIAGRDAELQALEQAYQRSRQQLRIVMVQGESGIGKTALVDAFVRRLQRAHPDALVLEGRCYENEQVSYKAFDGCMDALTEVLKRLPEQTARALVPPRAAYLAQLFPVLGGVPAIAQRSHTKPRMGPNAQRSEAFHALAVLLRRLSLQRPLVLIVDDLHWADTESLNMLLALAEDASAPAGLLLCTVRPAGELEGEVAEHLRRASDLPCAETLALGGLDLEGALQLAQRLFGHAAPGDGLRTVVSESRGHPMFLDALVRFASSQAAVEASTGLTLDAALAARLVALSGAPRRLLELLAMAGRPLEWRVAETALRRSLEGPLETLLASNLARFSRSNEIVCYHDRLRAVVAASVEPARRPEIHEALAQAFDARKASDPADSAEHWEHAGETARARLAYERAAEGATAALAFARAERMLSSALALTDHEDSAAVLRLTERRAHALANDGQSARAAETFRAAAELAEGEAKLELSVHWARHLLQSGEVVEGLHATEEVLSALGIPLPKTTRMAIASLVWKRVRLSMRRLELPTSLTEANSRLSKLQLQAVGDFSLPLAWLDPVRTAWLSTTYLLLAQDAHDGDHLLRALATEALQRTLARPNSPVAMRMRELSHHGVDLWRDSVPELVAKSASEEGVSALLRGEQMAARAALERADRLLREICPDQQWLLLTVRAHLARAWYYGGEHRLLAEESKSWLKQASQREDRFIPAVLCGTGLAFVRHLMEDQPDRARSELSEVMARWPRHPYSIVRFGELWGAVFSELYRGGESAWRYLEEDLSDTRDAHLLRSATIRESVARLQSQAALAAWVQAPLAQQPAWEKRASRALREAERADTPIGRCLLPVVRAQCSVIAGHREVALKQTRHAREVLETAGYHMSHCAAYLEGLLLGGDEGKQLRRAAEEFFRKQGWKHPESAICIHIPILPYLQ